MDAARLIAGALVWCSLAWGGWLLTTGETNEPAARQRWAHALWEYTRGEQQSLELRLAAPRLVALGDPIFARDAQGSLRRVGEITELKGAGRVLPAREAEVTQAQALLYPSAPEIGRHCQLAYMTTPHSLTWVLQTLLPAKRKQQIAEELSAALAEHREEILAALAPVVERSLREAVTIVEEELPVALARHRPELEALGSRYHQEVVEQELLPLVKEEIWPIVRSHGEPVVDEIGSKIWERVSLWRFGWRFAYDRAPLPERRLVEREWQRFVAEEAMPILEEHSEDLLRVVENSLRDTARNSEVRAALKRNLAKVLDDPELRKVIWQVFREVAIDNPRLRESLERHWTGPEARQAFRLASHRLEPTVRRVADTILGTPEDGITPEFAQVLRNQILHKDRRWFLLEPGQAGGSPPRTFDVRFGTAEMEPAAGTRKPRQFQIANDPNR